ncbi:RNA polymerase II transcription elongation factor domain-containing protein [Phthorimaea operculella]|nr:RNA polymerase II transcription elongation factor domain-containing protein [Phthorimaea operculella]
MADKHTLNYEVRELKLGASFTDKKASQYHTIKYDFKPASVDVNKMATVDVGTNNQVTVTVPHLDGAGVPQTVFKGSQRPYTKECVLIIDRVTGDITLEKLSSNIQVKKTRQENVPKARPLTPVSTDLLQNTTQRSQSRTRVATNRRPQTNHAPGEYTVQYNDARLHRPATKHDATVAEPHESRHQQTATDQPRARAARESPPTDGHRPTTRQVSIQPDSMTPVCTDLLQNTTQRSQSRTRVATNRRPQTNHAPGVYTARQHDARQHRPAAEHDATVAESHESRHQQTATDQPRARQRGAARRRDTQTAAATEHGALPAPGEDIAAAGRAPPPRAERPPERLPERLPERNYMPERNMPERLPERNDRQYNPHPPHAAQPHPHPPAPQPPPPQQDDSSGPPLTNGIGTAVPSDVLNQDLCLSESGSDDD